MTARVHDEDCVCFGCKARSIQFSPACTPTRRNSIPPAGNHNSWENGVKTDERGLPLVDEKLNPIPLKTYAAKRGHFEEQRRKLRTATSPLKE